LFVKTFREIGVKYQGLVLGMNESQEKEMAEKGMVIRNVTRPRSRLQSNRI
jgi:hypothetical protein